MNVQDVLDLVEIIHKTKDLGPEFKPITDLAFYNLRKEAKNSTDELADMQKADQAAADSDKQAQVEADAEAASRPSGIAYTPSPKALDDSSTNLTERRV